jgi:hypothetical protein
MASVIRICNLALSAVGVQQEIASITEGSTEANRCDLWYETCRDMVLRAFNWPFARRYEALGLVEADPNTEWGYAYRYPSDCLAIRRVVGIGRSDPTRLPYQISSDASGKLIFSDIEDMVILMTARIEDSEQFDPVFVSMLANLLGAKIGPGLARDAKLVEQAYGAYLTELATARAEAGNEEGQDPLREAESVQARA